MANFRCAEEWTTHQPSSRCILIPGLVKEIRFYKKLTVLSHCLKLDLVLKILLKVVCL